MKTGVIDILKARFLINDDAVKNWRFIVFIILLAIIMIANTQRYEQKVFEIAKLSNEVKELRSEFVDRRSELQKLKMESTVTSEMEKKQIYPSTVPPTKIEGKYSYYEAGEGTPIVILHGLMGGLSNFDAVAEYFPTKGYKVVIPDLPIYTQSILKTNVKSFAKYVKDFITFKGFDKVILLGNSLGGHIALYHTKLYPDKVAGLVITGSSGLYESAMGDSYPKRGDYEYIRKKAEDVFYDPKIATPELIDEVYATVNDRIKLIKTLTIAKSAIRHNMAKDLPKMTVETCIIWGKNDAVTPPNVAEEFDKLLPNSTLYWIDKCGHAAMMEHPQEFNEILEEWLTKKSL